MTSDANGKISAETIEALAQDFKTAATAEEGATAFTALVDCARRTEVSERSKVQRVQDVEDFLKPEGETQRKAVFLAKRGLDMEPPRV